MFIALQGGGAAGSANASTNGDAVQDDFDDTGSGKSLNRSLSKANGTGEQHWSSKTCLEYY